MPHTPTRLWILSDLHLENTPYPDAFDPPRPDFDVLVCPGDVWQGRCDLGFATLRRLAGDKPVVAVLGNHEHWNGITDETIMEAQLHAAANEVTLLEGGEAIIAGTRFVGTTLWSDYALAGPGVDLDQETGEAIMVPHEDGEHWLRARDARALHGAAKGRLNELVQAGDGELPLVVVTHHAPHPDCLPADQLGTWRGGGNASDVSSLTDGGRVALWAHGHIHEGSLDVTRPGGTRIVRNPAGRAFENAKFNEQFVVEV